MSRGEIVLDRDDPEPVKGTAYQSYKESNSTFKARKSFYEINIQTVRYERKSHYIL